MIILLQIVIDGLLTAFQQQRAANLPEEPQWKVLRDEDSHEEDSAKGSDGASKSAEVGPGEGDKPGQRDG